MTIRTKEAVEAAFRLRDKVLCEYCGHQILADAPEADPHRAVGDHRIPISRGGTHARTNISVVCYHCNKRKGPLTLAEFIAHFHDDQALAYMRTHVTNGLRDGTTVTLPTRWQRIQVQRAKRELRLADRIQPPDPGCATCGGSGRWRNKRGLSVYCACAIKDPRGRPQEASA